MSCLISFERCQSSCEECGTSEHYKKFKSTVGFEPPTPAPLVFQHVPLTPSATETVHDLILELLQYLLTLRYYKNSVPRAKGYTENENKRIADLQFGDWYHLHTRWLTQKKTFILSYVSMTIYMYNIYSFLLIIVYIFCIIIFPLYCIFVLDKKPREINRKDWRFMYMTLYKKPVFSLTKIRDNTTKIYFISTDLYHNVFLSS